MEYRNDLKIEFRAVSNAAYSKVLEFRINPNQDISYEIETSFFGLKFKRKKKFDTKWHRPYLFENKTLSLPYDEYYCYTPIFVYSKSGLEYYKAKYKTVGDFFAWLNDINDKEKSKWKKAQSDYLQHYNETWY